MMKRIGSLCLALVIGSVAWAQTTQSDPTEAERQRLMEEMIRRVFAGGGPYDIKYTYDQFVETNFASYPCAVPIMMQGMVVGNKLNLDMSKMMASNIFENLDHWVNSQKRCWRG